DIFSPITDGVLPNKTSADEARKAGRYAHEKPTPSNSIVLLVDHQIGLMSGVRDFVSLAEYKSNVVGLARTAKALSIPTLITTSNAQWQNGDTLPEIKDLFPDQPIYRRTGIINCYEDPT
ncbi:MAG: cysteine hydrolase family protein, partial [Nostoc sp.]